MFGIILGAIGVAVAGVATAAAVRPNSFRVQRSLSIKAAPEAIFDQIQDFRKWRNWSPWENIDPDLMRTYSGADAGKGAAYVWEGKKAGIGRMDISEAVPSSKVVIRLEFLKPIKALNTTEFTLQKQGDHTVVTWAMFGPSPFMSKLFGLVFNMDKICGNDFEKGLAALKSVVETT